MAWVRRKIGRSIHINYSKREKIWRVVKWWSQDLTENPSGFSLRGENPSAEPFISLWSSSIVYLWFAVDPREKTIHLLQHRCRKKKKTTTCCSSQLSVSSSKIGYLFTTSVMFFFASLFLMFYYFFCRSWRKFSILTGGSWLPSRMLRQSFRYGVQHGCWKFMEKVKYLAS